MLTALGGEHGHVLARDGHSAAGTNEACERVIVVGYTSIVADGRARIGAVRSRQWAIGTWDLEGQSIGLRRRFTELLARLDAYLLPGKWAALYARLISYCLCSMPGPASPDLPMTVLLVARQSGA
jgi:hypothetical protein